MKTMGTMEFSIDLARFTANSRKLNKHHAAPFAREKKTQQTSLGIVSAHRMADNSHKLSRDPPDDDGYWTNFNRTEQDPDSVKYKGDLEQMKVEG